MYRYYIPKKGSHGEGKICNSWLTGSDEFSMMKSDQLYQVDLRLRELKQNNMLFGGVAVLLFGDPAQLRPVKGGFVWQKS